MFKKIMRQWRRPTNKLSIENESFNRIIAHNRKTLSFAPNWLDETAFDQSFFGYGMPENIRERINNPISNAPTYSDYICYFSKFLKEPINYLEIGVSVGKNFFQVLNFVENAQLTAFEIEEINPPLEQFLKKKNAIHWSSLPTSVKKNEASLTDYTFEKNRNTIHYLSADVFDEKSWQQLAGQKFNLIFSDAFHDVSALKFEYAMLVKYNLLADKFIIFWDDLHTVMEDAFVEISKDLIKNKKLDKKQVFIFKTSGWIGDAEPQHSIGLTASI